MNRNAETVDTVRERERERERELYFNEITNSLIKIENKKIVVKA